MNNQEKLAKQRLFCYYFAECGDGPESALRAGFQRSEALAAASEALLSKSCLKLIEKLLEAKPKPTELVELGLRRLAFGSANDAAALVFLEEAPDAAALGEMNLFNVSEMKRVKGGGVEIKLFDRQKALERLHELSGERATRLAAAQLMTALGGGDEYDGA